MSMTMPSTSTNTAANTVTIAALHSAIEEIHRFNNLCLTEMQQSNTRLQAELNRLKLTIEALQSHVLGVMANDLWTLSVAIKANGELCLTRESQQPSLSALLPSHPSSVICSEATADATAQPNLPNGAAATASIATHLITNPASTESAITDPAPAELLTAELVITAPAPAEPVTAKPTMAEPTTPPNNPLHAATSDTQPTSALPSAETALEKTLAMIFLQRWQIGFRKICSTNHRPFVVTFT